MEDTRVVVAGHAHPGITYGIYTHRSNGQDRPMADHMGSLVKSALIAKNPALATDLAAIGRSCPLDRWV